MRQRLAELAADRKTKWDANVVIKFYCINHALMLPNEGVEVHCNEVVGKFKNVKNNCNEVVDRHKIVILDTQQSC